MLIVFEEFYKPSMKCLRLTGAHPSIVKDWRWAVRFLILHGYFTIYFICCSFHLMFVDIKNRDLVNACSNGIFFMVYGVVSFQYAVMLIYRDNVALLIKYQEVNFVKAQSFSEEDQKMIHDYARRGRLRCYWWLVSTIITLLMFPIKGTFLAIRHYFKYGEMKLFPFNDNIYPAAIEQHRDKFVVFILIYFLFFLYAFYCILMYTGFTPLGSIFMLNTCAQVELTIKQASNLFAGDEFNKEESNKRIKNLILDMHHIYMCIKIINQIFSLLFELSMQATTIMIPVSLFIIIWIWTNTGELGTDYIMFVFTSATMIYEMCYYSDILMEKGEELRQTIYACSWENYSDINLRKTLIIMMIRTLTPMVIKTPFRPLCFQTFSTMCTQSYTIFNVMNASLR